MLAPWREDEAGGKEKTKGGWQKQQLVKLVLITVLVTFPAFSLSSGVMVVILIISVAAINLP